MRLGSMQFLHRWLRVQRRSPLVATGLLFLGVCLGPATPAQQRSNNTTSLSDLAAQNLNRVAASAAEIRAILDKDAGLMVELKRWIARDATEHGQILDDSDLTDDAVYARLESDIQFRSVATVLVGRYGFLLPKFDPNSELGRQHELLIQERAKWFAQNQEEQLAQGRPSASGSPEQEPRTPVPSSGPEPGEGNPPNLPGAGGDSRQREQLLHTEQEELNVPPVLPISASYNSASTSGAANLNGAQGLTQQIPGFGTIGQSISVSGGRNPSPANGLGSYGVGNTNGASADNSGMSGRGTSMTESATRTSALTSPVQPFDRRYPQATLHQPPDMIRMLSPYSDIPSLYDMYVQAVTRPEAPARFGAELFENGTRDPQLIPMDLPAGPDYVVGPGDGLSVDLWGGVSERLFRTVDREGRISLPEVGPVLVSGKSLADVQQNLQQILRTQFRDVSADVSLSRLRTIRVYEVGDIAKPGAYDISSLSTPLNALFVAGGPTPRGSLRILKHFRGKQLIQIVDVYDLLLHGVKTDIERLENGDTVQVPPIGPEVTVEGMVRRPAVYELKDEKTLASVLELAGGLLPAATVRHIEVQRITAHEKQTMLSLDIAEAGDASEVTKKLEGFAIHDGDRIRIYPIAPYNQDTVYLEGHVLRPGRYSYRADMRVSDVISSYKDLLPEPATQYAEIIRLSAPDFHPTVEGFDLANALANPSQAPVLHAMDTVRIFSRFDFENPPTVSVFGNVRAPGTYQTSGQIRLADAVHLAGGLAPDAQTVEAQVFRYLPDGKTKIFSVGLGHALDGDPNANIILQARDRLLIHRSLDAVQPSAASILGEVAKPGRYPLAQGMRVSDLIRLGGGLKHSADMDMADLAEYLVQNNAAGTSAHHEVHISAALAGNPADDLLLHDGDTLTIRQVPGWNELGAMVTVKGEVTHPGSYGIHPGERLSSVLARAGGFLPTAYPRGIVFQREDVRRLEQNSRDELIQRIRQEGSTFKTSIQETGQDQAALAQSALAQRNNAIEALQQAPVIGRLVVRMPDDLARFRGSPDDIEVRRGDTVFIPKVPQFVVVSGQVYNSNAITYRSHRNVGWYLRQAGGPTGLANTKAIFVVRASGSVVTSQGSGLWNGGAQSTVIEPGDNIVVPEKAVGGTSAAWKNLIAISQLASAAATTAFIATH